MSDTFNIKTYNRHGVTKKYKSDDKLFLSERVVFSRLKETYKNGRILDIGVGGGRTTSALLEISSDYCGIDYSAAMVKSAQERFPNIKFKHCDARDLSEFSSETVDVAVFSYNGIDYVGHLDRLRILKEVWRVLSPRGVFFFSTHNRNQPVPIVGWHPSTLGFREYPTVNPLRVTYRVLRYAQRLYRAVRLRKFVRHEEDFALLNDNAHNYGLITYYISIPKQVEQLRLCGFEHVIAIDENGDHLNSKDWPTYIGPTCYLAWRDKQADWSGESSRGDS